MSICNEPNASQDHNTQINHFHSSTYMHLRGNTSELGLEEA